MGMIARLANTPVYLDTNVFIYALEGHDRFAAAARAVLQAVCQNPSCSFTSELTLAEVLVHPLKHRNTNFAGNYRELLTDQSKLTLVPISRHTLIEAAGLRASTSVKLPDAIHMATALLSQSQIIVTQDHGLPATGNIERLLLSTFCPL